MCTLSPKGLIYGKNILYCIIKGADYDKKLISILISTIVLTGTIPAYAVGREEVQLMNSDAFIIYDGNSVCDIIINSSYVSDTESQRTYTQINRAVGDLRQDIGMVTGGID